MPEGKVRVTEIRDGYREPVLKEKDYISDAPRSIRNKLGAVADEVIRPDGDWSAFLPTNETQIKNFDTYGCTVFGATNQVEIYEKAKYGGNSNYSDRALYIMADISPPGADPQDIYEQIRIHGLIPEEDLPWSDDIKTLKEYASPNPLPSALLDKAHSWKYGLKHEWLKGSGEEVAPETIEAELPKSPISTAVDAWKERNGVYIRLGDDTHWTTTIIKVLPNGNFLAYDSYPPFLKEIDRNFKFKWAKKIYLGPKPPEKISFWERILDFMRKILVLDLKQLPPTIVPDEVLPPPAPKIEEKIWTKEELQGFALNYCKEEGLSPQMTTRLLKTVDCESQWNPKAKRVNTNGTIDYGLCQYNSKWYIGPNKPIKTVEEAYNPEIALKVMAHQFKNGRATDWICFRRLAKVGGTKNI